MKPSFFQYKNVANRLHVYQFGNNIETNDYFALFGSKEFIHHYKSDSKIIANVFEMLLSLGRGALRESQVNAESRTVKMSFKKMNRATSQVLVETLISQDELIKERKKITNKDPFTLEEIEDKKSREEFFRFLHDNTMAIHIEAYNKVEKNYYRVKTIVVNKELLNKLKDKDKLSDEKKADKKDEKTVEEKDNQDETTHRRHWYSCCR